MRLAAFLVNLSGIIVFLAMVVLVDRTENKHQADRVVKRCLSILIPAAVLGTGLYVLAT